MSKKIFKMKRVLPVLICCLLWQNLFAQVYFDTAIQKYRYEAKEKSSIYGVFNKLSILYIDNSFAIKLNGPDGILIVSDSGKVVYAGKLEIERIFKLRNNTFNAIFKKDQYFNLLDIEKNEVLEPLGSYNDFSILTGKNRVCLLNDKNHQIVVIDLDLNKKTRFTTIGKPLSVHTDFLTSQDIYYYQSDYPYRGVIDLKSNKEIIYDKIIDIFQINEKEILIHKVDHRFVIYNLESTELKSSDIDSFAFISEGLNKYIVRKGGKTILTNKYLEAIPFIENFQKLYFLNDNCYLIQIDNSWQFVNSKGKKIENSNLQGNDISIIKKTLWIKNKTQRTLTGIFPSYIKGIAVDGDGIEDINVEDSVVIVRNGDQLNIHKISGKQVQLLSSFSDVDNIRLTNNPKIAIFEKKSKSGLMEINGNIIVNAKFDIIISLNPEFFSVFNTNIPYFYLVDYKGKEYLK